VFEVCNCVVFCAVDSGDKVGEIKDECGYNSTLYMPLWNARGQFYLLV
jgi:hypothetical protein